MNACFHYIHKEYQASCHVKLMAAGLLVVNGTLSVTRNDVYNGDSRVHQPSQALAGQNPP